MSRPGERSIAFRSRRCPGFAPRRAFRLSVALALMLVSAAALPFAARAANDDLIEVYDRYHQPLRTRAIEVSPATVDNSVERQAIHVRVTLSGRPAADGELVVRQIGGNECGAFYGRLVAYKAGQDVIEVDCHLNPVKGRRGTIVVQGFITSSYKALAGAVTTELQIAGTANPAPSVSANAR